MIGGCGWGAWQDVWSALFVVKTVVRRAVSVVCAHHRRDLPMDGPKSLFRRRGQWAVGVARQKSLITRQGVGIVSAPILLLGLLEEVGLRGSGVLAGLHGDEREDQQNPQQDPNYRETKGMRHG